MASSEDRERSRRFRERHRERLNAKARERRAAGLVKRREPTPEEREAKLMYMRNYYAANKARMNAQSRAYHEARKGDPVYKEARRRDAARKNELTRAMKILTGNERKVEDHLCTRVVQERNGFCPKFHDPGRKGAPDRIVMLPGYASIYVELKRPVGGKLEQWQVNYHKELRRVGQEVHVLWSKDEVDAFMAAHPPRCDLV